MIQPKITVGTVCYNAANCIENLIRSCLFPLIRICLVIHALFAKVWEKIEYLMGEEKVDGYLVKLKMTYVDDLGYDTEASVVVCKEDGVRWSVVDFQPTLTPEYEE